MTFMKGCECMGRAEKITQQIFDAVKICLNNGNTISETAKFIGISSEVVGFIKNAKTLDDYRERMNEKVNKARESREKQKKANVTNSKPTETKETEDKPKTVIVQASWQMTQEMQKTNELLKQISAKLAFIVDELTGVKT